MKRPQQRQRAGEEHPRGPVGPLRAADDRLLRDIEKLLLDELSLSFVLEREDLFPLLSGKAELCERA